MYAATGAEVNKARPKASLHPFRFITRPARNANNMGRPVTRTIPSQATNTPAPRQSHREWLRAEANFTKNNVVAASKAV